MATKTAYLLDTINNNVYSTNYPEFHTGPEIKRLTKAEFLPLRKAQTRAELLQSIKPGQTVWTQVLSVSASGMSRKIKFYIVEGSRIRNISGQVAELTGHKWADNGAVVFNGCGMDMAWNGVYLLGLALWPNGTAEPHGTRNGEPDTNGGYALKHEHM
jgi:hypothetical protein